MRTLSLRMSDAKFKRLERLAQTLGLSNDEVVCSAVECAIEDEGWLLTQNKPLMARLKKTRRDELAGKNQVSWDSLKKQYGL